MLCGVSILNDTLPQAVDIEYVEGIRCITGNRVKCIFVLFTLFLKHVMSNVAIYAYQANQFTEVFV